MYHAIEERGADPTRELVPPHARPLFEAQMRHLRAAYRPVPASRLLHEVSRRRRGQRLPVAVTFDDDLACHRTQALPVLQRVGVPATFFLSGASLERAHSFWWERLQRAVDRGKSPAAVLAEATAGVPQATEQKDRGALDIRAAAAVVQTMDPASRDAVAERLLSLAGPDPDDAGMRAADVRALADAGLEIGFHTLRHYELPGLDDEQLARAMTDGAEAVAELTGGSIDVISYPHGRADSRVARAAAAAGFRSGFTNRTDAVRPDDDPLLLGRLEPSFESAGQFAAQLALRLLRP
jgi:peptidoglycan/xylan/chitin deacetylase (PgdA/CDA1 family)